MRLTAKHFILPIALLALFVVFPDISQAKQFELFPGEQASVTNYREYIRNFYRFSIGAGILIATVLIMIGGIMWTTSAGNPGRIDKAKDYITDSIIGVVLLLGAYTILSLINPGLVNLPQPTFPKLDTFRVGSCVTFEGDFKKCTDADNTTCDGLAVEGKPKPEFTPNVTCATTCPVKDKAGNCASDQERIKEEIAKQKEGNGKSNDQIKCEAADSFGGGYIMTDSGFNAFETDDGNCNVYCKSAGGPNCVVKSTNDIDGPNMICYCQYTGADKK